MGLLDSASISYDVSFYENAIMILGVFVAALGVSFGFITIWQTMNYDRFKKEINKKLESAINKINSENQKSKEVQESFMKASVNLTNGNISISEKSYDEAIVSLISAMNLFHNINLNDKAEGIMQLCIDIIEQHDKHLKASHSITLHIDHLIEILAKLPTEIGTELYTYLLKLKEYQFDKVRKREDKGNTAKPEDKAKRVK